MENQIKKTLLGGVAQKIKLRHPLFCFKNFVILVFLNQLEFTYGSSFSQYKAKYISIFGKPILSYDHPERINCKD